MLEAAAKRLGQAVSIFIGDINSIDNILKNQGFNEPI
jgi:hypothetical protein